jgi:hypothetical protein
VGGRGVGGNINLSGTLWLRFLHVCTDHPQHVYREIKSEEALAFLVSSSDKLTPLSLLPAINYRLCCCYRRKINRRASVIESMKILDKS